MAKIIVSGLINIETTLKVEGFPIPYEPVRFPFHGVNASVSGVGINIAKALHTLGDQVAFLSLVGRDDAAQLVRSTLRQAGVSDAFVLGAIERTCQSVILYEPSGRRMINVDLKDIQQQAYPPERFAEAAPGCDLAVLCNINFSRALLQPARAAGLKIATDVHTIHNLDDDYNRDFMAAADILFMSHESLPCPPREWMNRVFERFPAEIVVIGLGQEGALLGLRSERYVARIPAVQVRPVVNTIGAGDALFSAFIHFYARSGDPHSALRRAVLFAGYKVGATGAADGFLDEAGLEALLESHAGRPDGRSTV